MAENKSPFILFILFIPIILFLLCTELSPTNPHDDDYEGDYQYTITWDSLGTAVNDTIPLEIFRNYRIPFLVHGIDTFSFYKITDYNNTVLADSILLNNDSTDGKINVYFKAPYTGYLYFKGVRPNKKEDVKKSTLPVLILNPYSLMLSDSIIGVGESVKARIIKVIDSANVPSFLKTIWQFNNFNNEKLAWGTQYVRGNISTNSNTLAGGIADTVYGQIFWINTVSISVNGHRPVIDTVYYAKTINQGDTLTFTIALSDADSDSVAVVIKSAKESYIDSSRFYGYVTQLQIKADKPVIDTGSVSLTLYIKDKSGLVSEAKQLGVTVNYKIPMPVFSEDYKIIPLLDTFYLSCYDPNKAEGNRYFWELKREQIKDTTNTPDSFAVYKSDTLADTLYIFGMNKYGNTGKRDSMIVQAKDLHYTLSKVTFPNELRCRRWVWYVVSIKDSVGNPFTDNAQYIWGTVPDTVYDSIKINKDTCRLFLNDSVPPFTLSAHAIVEGIDTTNKISETIVTRTYRPECRFKSDTYQGKVGETIRLEITTHDNDTIKSIYMRFLPGGDTIHLGLDSIFDTAFASIDTFDVVCWALDNDGFLSVENTASIITSSTKPVFDSLSKEMKIFIKDTVELNVHANPGSGNIVEYFWDTDGDEKWNDTTKVGTYQITFIDTGKYTVYAGCRNSFNDTAVARCRITVTVDAGKPRVDSAYTDKRNYYINMPCTVTVICHDTNGVIKRAFIDTSGDGNADVTVNGHGTQRDTVKAVLTFSNAGSYQLWVWVEDEDTVVSMVYAIMPAITVDPGIPVVDSIKPVTGVVYIKDSVSYRIHARDDKVIVQYEYSLDGTSWADNGASDQFNHVFIAAGLQYVWARVTDNELNVSDSLKAPVEVKLGAPVVDSLKPDTVWVMDSMEYKAWFHDENDTVKSVRIAYGDGIAEIRQLSGKKDSVRVWHKYGVSGDTTYRCSVTVMDNDSVQVVRGFNVLVLQGNPRVDSVWIDTVETALFINDTRKYHVRVSDTNDYVTKVYVSWSDDSTADDSITFPGTAGMRDTFFIKSFASNQAGSRTLNFWCRDKDGIVSWIKDKAVNVRPGVPELWGDTGDTTWVIIDDVPGQNYTLHINSFDTNGTISRYYWQETPTFDTTTGSCVKTNDSTRVRLIGANDVNKGLLSWIYGRDDDGLLGGKQFVVYADSVPPKPTITHSVIDTTAKISWSGKDGKDGNGTLYKIVCDKNANPTAVISDFKAGSLYDSGAPYDFSYTFTPSQGNGIYYYKIVSKDARGSITESVIGNFNY